MNIAHSLYALYETLPTDTQLAFLQELLQKQREKLDDVAFHLACQQTRDENEFLSDEEAQAFIENLPQ